MGNDYIVKVLVMAVMEIKDEESDVRFQGSKWL